MWLLMLYICDHLLVFYIACAALTQLALTSIIKKEEHEHINNRKEEEGEYINNRKEREAKNTWFN